MPTFDPFQQSINVFVCEMRLIFMKEASTSCPLPPLIVKVIDSSPNERLHEGVGFQVFELKCPVHRTLLCHSFRQGIGLVIHCMVGVARDPLNGDNFHTLSKPVFETLYASCETPVLVSMTGEARAGSTDSLLTVRELKYNWFFFFF